MCIKTIRELNIRTANDTGTNRHRIDLPALGDLHPVVQQCL